MKRRFQTQGGCGGMVSMIAVGTFLICWLVYLVTVAVT
jgi:hypothetical protein